MRLKEGTLLKVNNVSKRYLGREVVKKVSFSLLEDEFISFVGKSGIGKTTLLRIVAGLTDPDKGTVIYNPVLKSSVGLVGYVFQKPALLPWRNAYDNVKLPLELSEKEIVPSKITEMINLVGLKGFENAYPDELSGGMQQRLSIARALIVDPKVLLMDEPFSGVDEITRYSLSLELLRIWKSKNTSISSIIYITHSISEAVFLSDRIFVLSSKSKENIKKIRIDLPHPRTESVYYSNSYNKLVRRVRNHIQ